MKTKLNLLCTALVIGFAITSTAAEKSDVPTTSPEFAQMKTLVGKWTGKADMGQGPVEMTLEYRLIAGGSVLEERCQPGTPQEMVTMYYDQKGKLAMTHYCVFGNRPMMKLKSWDGKTIKFDFDPTCGINTKKESHMHAVSITFDDKDTITTSAVAMIEGAEQPCSPAVMKRVKE